MNRFRRIYILLGILAVSCIATFVAIRHKEHQEQIKNSEEVILEVKKDSVKSLSFEHDAQTFSFQKEDKWIYEDDEAFPVDEEKIKGLLEPFESFGVSFVIEEVDDYSQYGLEDPICTIHLETEDKSYEILLGSYSEMDSKRYVSIGDGNAYLVEDDPFETFDVGLKDLIQNDEIPSFEKITSVSFSGMQNYSITYEKDSDNTYCADDVYFTERDGKKKPLDTSLVDSYMDRIKNLSLTDYVTYHATEKELVSYGLDSPKLTVTLNYSYENEEEEETSDTFVLHVGHNPEEKKKDIKTSENDGEDLEEEEITAYVRVGESQIVYQILEDDYEGLMAASYNDLRHQEVLSVDFADIMQMDISIEEDNYMLTSEEKDNERIWKYQDKEVEISDLKMAYANLKAESFTEQSPSQKKEIGLTVYLDNESYPQILVELYRNDGDTCLAVVDGEPVSLVQRSAVVDFIEAVHAIVLEKEK